MGQEESTPITPIGPPRTLTNCSLSAVASYILSGAAKRIVVLTGAGISTAAGIPDFRSPGTGLYANLACLNLPEPEAVFDIEFFREQPQPFYVLAKELYPGRYHPTVSHAFISLLARKKLLHLLFTQNIDCLERSAGVPGDLVVEAHGSFATQRCVDCKVEFSDDKMKEHVTAGLVPRCEDDSCRGLVKPDIVFFGEPLPKRWEEKRWEMDYADLVLVIGTSLSVYPFASLPEMVSHEKPRVLLNRERVGRMGLRSDDVLALGTCDDGIRKLADELGWGEELEEYWESIVGKEEAERQRMGAERHRGEEEIKEEVEKLAAGIEAALSLGVSDATDGVDEVEDKEESVPSEEAASEESKAKTERVAAKTNVEEEEAEADIKQNESQSLDKPDS